MAILLLKLSLFFINTRYFSTDRSLTPILCIEHYLIVEVKRDKCTMIMHNAHNNKTRCFSYEENLEFSLHFVQRK